MFELSWEGVGFNGATDLYRWKRAYRPRTWPADRIASMGPPIYIGGNKYNGASLYGHGMASMGPPIYIGGNDEVGAVVAGFPAASMGPPIYIGGNQLSVEWSR